MKKIFLLILLALPAICFCQLDTNKVEQYCEVVAIGKLFSRKVSITVDYGQFQRLFSDMRLKDEQGKVQNFNSVVDALNYLGIQGWKLVNAFPMTDGGVNAYHFYFKKEIDKSKPTPDN